MKTFFVIALGLLLYPRAKAQDAVYNFNATCLTTCNNPGPDCPGVGNANATSFNSSVIGTAGPFTVSPSLSLGTANCSSPVFSTSMNGFSAGNPANPSRARWASGWTTSVTANANHYFTATLWAATYATVGMTQIIFDESRSSTGPHMCQVMVSADGGPFTLLWQGVIPDNTSWRSWSITSFTALAPMPTFSNTLTVRFQGFASEAATGSWRIDNVRFFAGIVNLPIELLSFTGHKTLDGVQLDWTTATEQANDYFTLLRSADAENCEPIGYVDGAGNSTSTLNYSFVDEEPLNGFNYYQLQQTDWDGDSTLSHIVVVPFMDNVISLSYPLNSTVSWSDKETCVVDALGRIVQGYTNQHFMRDLGIYYLRTQEGETARLIITTP